jgi:hypothetical protein
LDVEYSPRFVDGDLSSSQRRRSIRNHRYIFNPDGLSSTNLVPLPSPSHQVRTESNCEPTLSTQVVLCLFRGQDEN